MSKYNPYVLSLALEDFQFEVRSWTSRMRESVADLQYELRLGAEATSKMRSLVTHVQEECETDTQLVAESDRAVAESRMELDQQSQKISRWEKYLDQQSDAINKHRRYWEIELEDAGAWVSEASTALNVARTQLDKAKSEYYRAERAYETAREKDESTTYEARQLQAAREKLSIATTQFNLAQIELDRANARKEACGEAVSLVREAFDQHMHAKAILNDVYQSYGEADSAQTAAESLQQDAIVANTEERNLADQAHANTTQAETEISTASLHMNRIINLEQESYTYADGAIGAIGHRVDKLRMLDFTDLSI